LLKIWPRCTTRVEEEVRFSTASQILNARSQHREPCAPARRPRHRGWCDGLASTKLPGCWTVAPIGTPHEHNHGFRGYLRQGTRGVNLILSTDSSADRGSVRMNTITPSRSSKESAPRTSRAHHPLATHSVFYATASLTKYIPLSALASVPPLLGFVFKMTPSNTHLYDFDPIK